MTHQSATMAAPLAARPSRLPWVFQIIAAVIMGQTLFFKFTGAPESVEIFETLGAEPWGRIGSGAIELVAVVLLLIPRSAAFGGLMTMGLMGGAIASHLFLGLGIEVADDGGALFGMAIITFVAGAVVAFLRRSELPIVGSRFARR